jgi:hypothetical protein
MAGRQHPRRPQIQRPNLPLDPVQLVPAHGQQRRHVLPVGPSPLTALRDLTLEGFSARSFRLEVRGELHGGSLHGALVGVQPGAASHSERGDDHGYDD